MRKESLDLGSLLLKEEKRIREQAEQIIAAKEIGISQQSIDKMVCWLSISKASYDDLKRRYEKYGE